MAAGLSSRAAGSGETLLAVDNLAVRFPGALPGEGRDISVVAGISYEIAAGRTLGVVGESGCGKSMTALALLGLVPAPGRVAGSVRFEGAELLGQSEAAWQSIRGARIAMIFQEPMTALNPVIPIGAQIAEALELHDGLSGAAARERAIALLAEVGIPSPHERADAYPHQLSGGMRQRGMIAMALACQPALLIADEPTTALDVTIQAQILELMAELQDRVGMAIQLISHNLGVVSEIADDIIVMYAGRIVERAPAAALFAAPRHPYTMALLHSVPRLDRPRQARLDPIEGQPPDLTRLDRGCSFRPRCRFAVDLCATAPPPLLPAGAPGQLSACYHSNELGSVSGEAA